ncbi:MAG: T9SS type A sorting domain-containing protein [Bacteroidia bacterium]|nr:T9SS type A sorting domain-containing protein [Bacteroidia bacterium]
MVLSVLFFLFCFSGSFAQELQEAPLNAEFINYFQKSVRPEFTDEGYPLNYLPPPVRPFFHKKNNEKSLNTFPAKFDWRDSNYVTSVKNQNPCGCCWVFATLASVESNWLKNHYGSYDLSEENMKDCHGFEVSGCTSGNDQIASAYLTRGSGPVPEIMDPYIPSDKPCNSGFSPVALITNAVYFPNDKDIVKQAILDYGGVFSSMFYQTVSFNSTYKTYYYSGNSNVNHAVLIIGWDDSKITAGGTGAWIAKNSWGISWGNQGYFYISYQDAKVLSDVSCFPDKMDYKTDMKLFLYDELGRTSDLGYSSNTAFGLVSYVASGKQKITKVGLIINSEDTKVDIELYSAKKGDHLFNVLSSVHEKIFLFPGYYAVDLPNPVHLNKDEEFYIKVKYYTPGYTYPVPFERAVADYADPSIENNVCWVSSNGDYWEALGKNLPDRERDLCIRAYAFPDTVVEAGSPQIRIYPNPSFGFFNMDFQYNEEDEIHIELYSAIGILIYSKSFRKYPNQIVQRFDFTELAKGVYFLKVNSSKTSEEFKIVFI